MIEKQKPTLRQNKNNATQTDARLVHARYVHSRRAFHGDDRNEYTARVQSNE